MPDDSPAPICPVCGQECETMYRDFFGTYVGCDVCVETKDAWEVPNCFPQKGAANA